MSKGKLLALLASLSLASAAQAATFTFRSTDAAGEGLNDATPFSPVGGNTATTLGEARMNVLREAGRIWGSLLQSNVDIQVDAAFDALTCTTNSGTLGSAGARSLYRNFSASVPADTYYVSALADSIAGRNLSSSASAADILATFNSSLDNNSSCLFGVGFYYGFDHNRGSKIDLLLVVLHELGHGLGFSTDVDLTDGSGIVGSDSVERFSSYTYQIFDEALNKTWPAMTASERVQSAVRTGQVAWNGTITNAQRARYTNGFTAGNRVRLNAPATVSQGSSISHWDPLVTPSAIMEPSLPGSIVTSSTDITVCALQDIGWQVTQCPHFATNRIPVAASQTVTTPEDTPITITLSATDADGDPLTYSVVTAPSAGGVSAIASSSHTLVYTPNANAIGTDSFTFKVNDGSADSNVAAVTINVSAVNDAPVASNISTTTQTATAKAITLLGSDVDGDTLTYAIVNSPANGVITGTGANLSYRPNDGFAGTDTFTYRVSDGTLNSATATVSVTVQPPTSNATESSSGSSGGGSLRIDWLALLALLVLTRGRFYRKRAQPLRSDASAPRRD